MRIIKTYTPVLLFFLGEAILAIIHLYYGISSLMKMLYDNFRLKLYYTMFWNYDKSTYKNWDYMDKAITYHMNPIYCILMSIAISLLFVLFIKHNKEKTIMIKILIILSILIFVVSLIITVGVLYCYCDEMSHEVA